MGPDGEEQKVHTMDVFQKLLQAAGTRMSAGQRTKLQFLDGQLCCVVDQEGAMLYCVVTSRVAYPERLAFLILYDLMHEVSSAGKAPEIDLASCAENGLDGVLHEKMKELVRQYESPESYMLVEAATSGRNENGDSFNLRPGPSRRNCL